MPDIEEVKEEFSRLDSRDKRWILVSLAVVVAALISAALGGSLLGDLVAFIVTLAAGWIVHDQWNAVHTSRTTRTKKPATPRAHRPTTRRKTRTASKSH
jgi:hypothetical protein